MTDPVPLPGSLPLGELCFACGLENPRGLQIPYLLVGGVVEATFSLGVEHSGAPAYVHGGVTMTILDEAMSWATIALRSLFAVTTEFTSRFRRPVLIDQPHTVRATCGELAADGRTLVVTGTVTRADGKVCAEAEGSYFALTLEETAAVSGVPELPAQMQRLFGTAP